METSKCLENKHINILNWYSEDVNFKKFVIYGFGKDSQGENYTLKITNFQPENVYQNLF